MRIMFPQYLTRFLCFAISLFLYGQYAFSSTLLDQSVDRPVTSYALDDSGWYAQTFTMGLSGYLTQIDLRLFRYSEEATGDFTVAVFGTSGGLIDSNKKLFETTLSVNDLDIASTSSVALSSFDVSKSGIYANADDMLAIGLGRTVDSQFPDWVLASVNNIDYAGGALYFGSTGQWREFSTNLDFQTFVNPIPETTTLIMMAMGLTIIGIMRKRRKHCV